VNRSFRLPTFTDLYYQLGGAQGSAQLRPEYAWNSELGLSSLKKSSEGSRILTEVLATLYERRGVNLIDWIYRSIDGSQVLQADNVTSVRIRGLELAATGMFYGTWSIRAQFAGHRASMLEGVSTYALDYLAQRVQLRWDSEIRTQDTPSPFQFGLSAIGQNRAGSYLNAAAELTPYAPFATVDLRASYRLGELLLFADGMNLLNATVVDRGSVPLPGRWVKLGIRLEWD
jgi:iron complex outermembrane receptor protein